MGPVFCDRMVSIKFEMFGGCCLFPAATSICSFLGICIFSVQGAIVNLGCFYTSVRCCKQSIPPPGWALTLFILVFAF